MAHSNLPAHLFKSFHLPNPNSYNVYLVGSRLWGTNTDKSDWDVLIVGDVSSEQLSSLHKSQYDIKLLDRQEFIKRAKQGSVIEVICALMRKEDMLQCAFDIGNLSVDSDAIKIWLQERQVKDLAKAEKFWQKGNRQSGWKILRHILHSRALYNHLADILREKQTNYCSKITVYLKATCSVFAMILISTILWIIGCEILWHGTWRIEDIYQAKKQFYIYKIIILTIFLGFGIIMVIISASLVLFGIPFTVFHIDHLFNRRRIKISNTPTIENNKLQNQNSKQAFIWAISIFVLVIIGLAIGGIGCEVVHWSGLKFRALFKNNVESDKIHFYLKQCLFLAIMFAGLLLSFIGLLLAPFMLAFAGVVSFDKKRSSYRFRSRRHRR
ncbi:unnamed protein product [Adineta steineri]|uniref:Polymerase nucleotidyl transferase domain-containing protein n=1 Tax=Adineta steineri TaxID=433720 RepID=A0A818PIM1_9BILA|nr:unnamed protein product [Adineta steineri]